MYKHILILLFSILGTKLFAQKLLIKTNVMNLLIIPSLHVEYGIGKKSSLQYNFHRASFVFFSRTDLINTSLDYRQYFGKEKGLKGFYVSPGIHYGYDYKAGYWTDTINNFYTAGGNGALGIIVRAGYQVISRNERFCFDLGAGLVTSLRSYPHKDLLFSSRSEYRVMLGLGVKLF